MRRLTYETVSEVLRYDSETGKFYWKYRPRHLFKIKHGDQHGSWNTKYAFKEALTALNGQGYKKGAVFGVTSKAHRLAWLLHYKKWPENEIDHINGNRADNRIDNLRDVPRKLNVRNQKLHRTNTSGTCGVMLLKTGRWQAVCYQNKKRKSLGIFKNKDDAISARKKFDSENGYTERHGVAIQSQIS